MGWTKQDIINEAFNELGLGDYVFDLSSSQQQSALRRLDQMIAMWDAKSIRLGYPLPEGPSGVGSSSLTDETNLQDLHLNAVVLNLAVQIAPAFGKQVSIETKRAARDAYNTMLTLMTFPREMQMPQGMPRGAGYKEGSHLDQRFFTTSDPLRAGDDELEIY